MCGENSIECYTSSQSLEPSFELLEPNHTLKIKDRSQVRSGSNIDVNLILGFRIRPENNLKPKLLILIVFGKEVELKPGPIIWVLIPKN